MEKNLSAPLLQGQKNKYNVKQYRGLLANIEGIKDHVENERAQSLAREKYLEDKFKERDAEASLVQKELSVQLRCAGRSYQTILTANHELGEQLRAEEERRQAEVTVLEQQVKELKLQLSTAAKPWKEEIGKRDTKILRLQEAAIDKEKQLKATREEIPGIREGYEKELVIRKDALAVLVQELADVRDAQEGAIQVEREKAEAIKVDAVNEAAKLRLKFEKLEVASAEEKVAFEKTIKELELNIKGLENQIARRDRELEACEVKFDRKDLGLARMSEDFKRKEVANHEQHEKIRASFEAVIARMDAQIQDNEREYERRLAPWKEMVEVRDAKIVGLGDKIEEMKKTELEKRKLAKETEEELREELAATKGAVDSFVAENVKLRKALEKAEHIENDENSAKRQVIRLNMMLDDTTAKCEKMIMQKEKELKEKTDMVMRLQRHVAEENEEKQRIEHGWETKVQGKEEGYGKVVAQLKFAESQVVEERGRTAAMLATVKKRDRSIERLKGEHTEELRIRKIDHEKLAEQILILQEDLDVEREKTDVVRFEIEEKFDTHRLRAEEREADLRIEMVRRDRDCQAMEVKLQKIKEQFEKARLAWEEKERELEVILRGRDRAVAGLKNEIEFINDSWDIKYNRLMGVFEKLQKKFDDIVGPNGVIEIMRRAKDLKAENVSLSKEIAEQKETIKKQKRQIRDIQLDIDAVMKETADIVADKDRAVADMVGEVAKLNNQLRDEIELRENLMKTHATEKFELVESFRARIEQLEQLVESMRFTDRQELVDRIEVWKRAYERVCLERDQAEDTHKELLDVKELQMAKLASENWNEKIKFKEDLLTEQGKYYDLDEAWKRKEAAWRIDAQKFKDDITKLEREIEKQKMELKRQEGLFDQIREDPEKIALRKEIEEWEKKLAEKEKGVKLLIQENTELRDANSKLQQDNAGIADHWEPQIRWRDERYEAMLKEHEATKNVLMEEMKKAQDSCKMIEEQVRQFPNPFEQELTELKAQYAQAQAGMQKLSMENLELREKILDTKDEAEKQIAAMEENLKLASGILQSVVSLGALKTMAKKDMRQLEDALGVDLDGDGKVG